MRIKPIFALLLTAAALTLGAFKTSEITVNGKNCFRVESDKLIIHFNGEGGRIDRIFSKVSRKEFVDPTFRGAFHQYIWTPKSGFDFYYKRPFTRIVNRGKDFITIEYRGHHQGGGLDMLIVTKKYTLRKGASMIDVEFDFEHMFEAMGKAIYGFHFHNGLTLPGSKTIRYRLPTAKGVIDYAGCAEEGNDTITPSRGWLAAVSSQKEGFSISVPFPELDYFMLWGRYPPRTTVEWRLKPQTMAHGSHFKYHAGMVFFRGLPTVSGAGRGATGALIHPETVRPGTPVPVELKLFAALPGRYDIAVLRRESASGKWQPVIRKKFNSKRSDALLKFSWNEMRKNAGLTEFEAVIRRDAREITRLNSRIVFGKADREEKIDILEPKRGVELKRGDLTCFTHHTPDPDAVPWGKPLKGGPIKVLALTPNINQFGDLADRFDCRWDMSWVSLNYGNFDNPSYLLCREIGTLSREDVYLNIRKKLKEKYDVIFIGSIWWRYFPKDIQNTILQKLKSGTGIVYTGASYGPDWWRSGKRHGRTRSQLRTVGRSMLNTGIPFELFPPVYLFRQPVKPGTVVHVTDKNKVPYLMSTVSGKGRAVGFFFSPPTHYTGMIPYDPWEPYYVFDRPTPVELYFSMLSKAMLYAAGRKCDLEFNSFDPEELSWQVKAPAGKTFWEFRIYDRNNELRGSGKKEITMQKGINKVKIPFEVRSFAGVQYVSVTVRNAGKEVLNWGSWSFEKQPEFKIIKVKCTPQFIKDGDRVVYDVECTPNWEKKCKLQVEVTDSYGRTIFRSRSPRNSFRYTNALPSGYFRIRAYLEQQGKLIDTNGTYCKVRPAEHLLKWDDFKMISIIYWRGLDTPYRMRRVAEIYRKFGLDVLMNCRGFDFPLLNNFHTAGFVSNLIGSQNYPSKEYLKTGNKLLLARKNCISDPKNQEKNRKKMLKAAQNNYRHGVMFHSIGDELALSRSGSPVEFCFSASCLEKFRKFLQKRYGTLAKLNRAWESSFSDWNKVIPYTKEEVWNAKGRHAAGWADHREFMDTLVEEYLIGYKKDLLSADPAARMQNSGTQAPNAYGGLDWFKLMRSLDCLQNYNGQEQMEIQRSFAPANYLSIPWGGYRNTGSSSIYPVWKAALLGAGGYSMWCLHSGLLYPDHRLQDAAKDAIPALHRLRSGIGKLLMKHFKMEQPLAAILYSQSSLRAAFIEKKMQMYRDLWCKYVLLCRHSGVPFRFVNVTELPDLRKAGFRLLILPESKALSDREVAAIKKFAADGGTVLAEGMAATRYENCVPRKTPALKKFLYAGGKKVVFRDEADTDYNLLIAAPDSKLNRRQIRSEQRQFSGVLRRSNIIFRPVKLIGADGQELTEAEIYLRCGPEGALMAGFLTAYDVKKKVSAVFPRDGHCFELVSGRYLGYGKICKAEFSKGQPLLIVQLPTIPKLAEVTVKGKRLEFKVSGIPETVVRIRVFDPSGVEVPAYGGQISVYNGKGSFRIPFAISDVSGKWRVELCEVISNSYKNVSIRK